MLLRLSLIFTVVGLVISSCRDNNDPNSSTTGHINSSVGTNRCPSTLEEKNLNGFPLDLAAFLGCYKSQLAEWGVNIKGDNSSVILSDGSVFPLHVFKSSFEADLYLDMKDRQRAEIIYAAYSKNLALVISSPALREKLEWWLIRYNRFFNPKDLIDGTKYTGRISLYGDLQPFIDGEYASQFKAFLTDVGLAYGKLDNVSASTPGKNVVRIVTGPYGGGHASVAATVSATLKANNYDAAIVDECNDFSNPLKIVTNKLFSACLIYNNIEIKEGNLFKGSLLSHLNWLLSFYLVPNGRGELKEKLAKDKTTIIISSVHHINDITATSYALNRPLMVTVTDFSFPSNQYFDLDHVDANMVRYLIPTKNREFFRPMMIEYYAKNWPARVQSSRVKYINSHLFSGRTATELTAQDFSELGVFSFLGFPLKASMTYPRNAQEVEASKRTLKLNLDPNRKLVSIGFGAATDPNKVVELLTQFLENQARLESNIQLGVVTGGNEILIARARQFFLENNIPIVEDSTYDVDAEKVYSNKIIAKILPALKEPTNPIELLYKSTDVFISKAGGATTAELLATSTYYLRGFSLWPWEFENALLLDSVGLSLGDSSSTSEPLQFNTTALGENPTIVTLISQLNALMKKPRLFAPVPGYAPFNPAEFISLMEKMISKAGL